MIKVVKYTNNYKKIFCDGILIAIIKDGKIY